MYKVFVVATSIGFFVFFFLAKLCYHSDRIVKIFTKPFIGSRLETSLDGVGSLNTVLQNFKIGHQPEDILCKFPLLDPFDETIKSYFNHPQGHKCKQLQPWLTYLDDKAYLLVNQTTLSLFNKSGSITIKCKYRGLYMTTDYKIKETPFTTINWTAKIPLTNDTVEVICMNRAKVEIYHNFHNAPRKLHGQKGLPTTEDNLSVLMLLYDSVSQGAAKRNLPLTYKYLTERLGSFVFRGYNKIGDNTFPNLMGILVGKRAVNPKLELPGMPNELGPYFKISADHLNLIWKQFARHRGYLTGYMEDWARVGTFTSRKYGFTRRPADWYFRQYFLARRKTWVGKNSSSFCFGNEPSITPHLDVTRRLVTNYHKTRYFFFNFFTDLSHDYITQIERGDLPTKSLLEDLNNRGYLNHTIVFLMGDHGPRLSSIRNTLVGALEERLPLLTITFPPWLLRKFPHIQKNLAENQWRLTSNFDVYETLTDILHERYSSDQRPLSFRGKSLLYPISLNRTCFDAGVPTHYCCCALPKAIDRKSKVARKAAKKLVQRVNYLLKTVKDKCSRLKLKRISRAQVVQFSNNIQEEAWNDESVEYQVTVMVSPSDALLEGTLHYDQTTGKMMDPVFVSRLNAFGNQSACIDDAALVLYCYCIHSVTTPRSNDISTTSVPVETEKPLQER